MEELLRQAFQLGQQWVLDMNNDKEPTNFNQWYASNEVQEQVKNLNRMTEFQKEYCEEKGLIYIKPENTEISDYVNWLETQIQALRIHDVVGRSEQLSCGRNITTCVFYKDGGKCSNLEYCRDQTT